jgi:hypothetical protein
MSSTFIGKSKGGHIVSQGDLDCIATPEPTATWKPVSHGAMVAGIKQALANHGIEIASEGYSIASEGLNLFGVFDLVSKPNIGMPANFALGFRHSNRKQFAIQMVAGARVFVCSNLCFSGDMITLKRKHTSGLNLYSELNNGVARYVQKSFELEESILVMREAPMTDQSAKVFLLDSVVSGALPQTLLVNSYENYFDHPTQECEERTVWGLHNAVTRTIRDSNLVPTSKFEVTVKLGSAIRNLIR